MRTPEMGNVMPENDNAKFIDQFSSFGIVDQEMINKLLGYGKIVDIDVSNDSLEIFYKTGKHEKIIVRKSEVKKIYPKSGNTEESQTHFAVDLNPAKNYIKPTRGKKPNQEQYEQDSGMWG